MSDQRPHRLEIAVRVIAGILFCWGAGNLVMVLASMIFGTSTITASDVQKPELLVQQLSASSPTNRVILYIRGQMNPEEKRTLSNSSTNNASSQNWLIKQTMTNLLNRVMDQGGLLTSADNAPSETSDASSLSPRQKARRIMDQTFPEVLRPARHRFEVTPAWATLGYFLASTLVLHGGVLIVVHQFLRQTQSSWRTFLGTDHPHRWIFARLAVFTGVLSVGAMLVLKAFISNLMTWLGRPPDLQIPLQVLDQTSHPLQMLVFAFFTVISAPFVEECLFRGLLFRGINARWGWTTAGWVSSILFAVVHADLSTLVPLIALSWIFLILLKRTGCLFTTMLAHASFNTMNLILFMLAKHFRPDGP